MLQKIVSIIQNEPLRKQMIAAETDDVLLNLLKKAIA